MRPCNCTIVPIPKYDPRNGRELAAWLPGEVGEGRRCELPISLAFFLTGLSKHPTVMILQSVLP